MIRRYWFRTTAFGVLMVSIYFIFGWYMEPVEYSLGEKYTLKDELTNEFLVWSPKCHMLSLNPLHSSITQYVKKLRFEPCSNGPLLSSIKRDANGLFSLVIDENVATRYDDHVCCWAPITRPVAKKPLTEYPDDSIDLGECADFENQVYLPADLEIVKISCRGIGDSEDTGNEPLYENIHPILNPLKVRSRLNTSTSLGRSQTNQINFKRKLSILVLGIDSVSRLNFKRTLPKTERLLTDAGWFTLQGYNKMGDNTFPNLMAILTGQNSSQADTNCDPTRAYGLDNCPFLWSNFRKAGYVTAYAEDMGPTSTFNYQKTGFIVPPVDYYLRSYMLASERLLKAKTRFGTKYCSGPELEMDRVFDYAFNFAEIFAGSPYFGFFWTNTVSHNDVNGLSTVDDHLLGMFEKFEKSGVIKDTLVVFLSDHGMRWGEMRKTFIGWYEERLPFIYLRLPDWMREDTSVVESLRINEHRLTSPYDLYETFREVLIESGGEANASTGCSTCQSLFKPVPKVRGCADAGVSPHWCTCTALKPWSTDDEIIKAAAEVFIQHVEKTVEDYKDKEGRRLCAQLRIKKIHKVDRIIDFSNSLDNSVTGALYFYLIELTPGDGMFEVTIRIRGKGNYSLSNEEISRIDSYGPTSQCLHVESKKFCHCIER
ncbi:uncharacterized protein LOC107039467 isoform X2 [Diachasma alloeum]|uniref:uncharacterized protein LOC107039467 isoform X2 n=1 Tax=Diachasma alloeum TaxID=454923 RepID=UPI0007380FB9|nr:uncharacterized protein LOC107039467 isoform X2 [Diachasma alloeum]